MSGNNVQFYDFNLSAGGSQWLPVSGAFYRIISSTGPVSIREDVGTTVGPISAGQGMRNREFGGLTVSDKSGAANKGTLIIAGSDFVDDRITGEVSTIDGGKARSIAGNAFVFNVGPNNAAGFAAAGLLWNPAGSGRRLVVKTSRMSSTQAQFIGMARKLATVGTIKPAGIAAKMTGAASVAVAYEVTNTATAVDSGYFHSANVGANGSDSVVFQEPVIVQPGEGVMWLGNVTTAGAMQASAEYFEEIV